MNHCKPLIGINADHRAASKDSPAFSFLCAGYYDAVVKAGGVPLLIPPLADEADIGRVLDVLEGVVLVGGADLDPRIDGFMLHPSMRLLDRRREEFDRTLDAADRRAPPAGLRHRLRHAVVERLAGRKPLPAHRRGPARALPHADAIDPAHRHALEVEPGSLMERVYGEGEIRVNSMHHMAIDEVAPGFAVTARCPDGVVEAIESTMDDWFALGTQFHPRERIGLGLTCGSSRNSSAASPAASPRCPWRPENDFRSPFSMLRARARIAAGWSAFRSRLAAAEVAAAAVSVTGRGLCAGRGSRRRRRGDSQGNCHPASPGGRRRFVLGRFAGQGTGPTGRDHRRLDRRAAGRGRTGGDRVLAAGLHDPGFWGHAQGDVLGYSGWCDAARVAELTGLNVLDAFPARPGPGRTGRAAHRRCPSGCCCAIAIAAAPC